NVGVIGVAVFRERLPLYGGPRTARAPPPRGSPGPGRGPDPEPPPGGPPPPAAQQAPGREGRARRPRAPAASHPPGPRAREREYSYVQDTEFQRQQPEPNEVIRIRYDSMQNLVAMGIVRRPHPLPARPDAFPGSQREFVPDPPG